MTKKKLLSLSGSILSVQYYDPGTVPGCRESIQFLPQTLNYCWKDREKRICKEKKKSKYLIEVIINDYNFSEEN